MNHDELYAEYRAKSDAARHEHVLRRRVLDQEWASMRLELQREYEVALIRSATEEKVKA